MLELTKPMEVQVAVESKTASLARIESATIDRSGQVSIRFSLGDETMEGFDTASTKRINLELSGSLTASILKSLETALKAAIAENLGIGEKELSVR